jgi:hypothetical protein
MSHYEDAEMLLAMADHQAFAADQTDPWRQLAAVAGAAVSLLAAQAHATLALADAQRERAGREIDDE